MSIRNDSVLSNLLAHTVFTMKAMILCAGLGTRLRPWTLEHPKALVPVGGVPMLQRVSESLFSQGFDRITVNVHHFASQIKDFIASGVLPQCCVNISDESDCLLDTGGGILHAAEFLASDDFPFLVHNVDILSNADLKSLYDAHLASGRDITLLVSDRVSDRKLVFDQNMQLKGWVNIKTNLTRPACLDVNVEDVQLAFSGIYVMSPSVFAKMKANDFSGAFSIMDFLLAGIPDVSIAGVCQNGLELIDIGKPETLSKANLDVSAV